MLLADASSCPCTTAKRPMDANAFSAFSNAVGISYALPSGYSPGNCGKAAADAESEDLLVSPATRKSNSITWNRGDTCPPLPQKAKAKQRRPPERERDQNSQKTQVTGTYGQVNWSIVLKKTQITKRTLCYQVQEAWTPVYIMSQIEVKFKKIKIQPNERKSIDCCVKITMKYQTT